MRVTLLLYITLSLPLALTGDKYYAIIYTKRPLYIGVNKPQSAHLYSVGDVIIRQAAILPRRE